MKQILSIIIAIFICSSSLSAQLFNYKKITAPVGLNFSNIVTEFEDKLYLNYFDNTYTDRLFSYEDEVITEVPLPAGFSYGGYLTTVGNILYFSVNDNNFNTSLASLENDVVTVYPADGAAMDLGQFVFNENNLIYLQYWNGVTFDQELKIFDGATFTDLTLPAGFSFDGYMGFLDGKHYFFLEATSYEVQIFSYENEVFTPITTPAGLQFPFVQNAGSESIIFTAFDANFNQSYYEFFNDIVETIALPTGFDFIVDGPAEWKGDVYFGIADFDFQNDVLAKRATDGSWTIFDSPTGLDFQAFFDNGILEEEMNLNYVNPNDFINSLAIFNGSEISEVIPSPNDFDLSGFVSEYKGGKILSYFESYYYNNVLWYLKDGGLTQVPVPAEHPDYSFLAGRFASSIYLTFDQGYYDRALYQLSLNARPESADSTVTTFAESAYKFKLNDFPFSDTDIDGEIGGIQVSELPAKGILHLNGAQVNVNDIVTAADITTLFYVPLDDGIGSPYDQFKFRVYDGFETSDLDYTMFINVLSTSGVSKFFLTRLEVFPNPTTEIVNVNLNESLDLGNLQLTIFDNLGAIVLSEKITERDSKISLGNLNSGNYFLVINNDEESTVKKLSVVK